MTNQISDEQVKSALTPEEWTLYTANRDCGGDWGADDTLRDLAATRILLAKANQDLADIASALDLGRPDPIPVQDISARAVKVIREAVQVYAQRKSKDS